MTKDQTRNLMRNLNSKVTSDQRSIASKYIFSTIESLPQFATAHTIALYVALADEISTLEVIERWYSQGKRIVLPRITGESSMVFYLYQEGCLQRGRFGIAEPKGDNPIPHSEIDLMIVPGVAFCRDGSRLGRGGGYYDRYLSREDLNIYNIGICYSHQLLNTIPCESHDIILDMVISDNSEVESQPTTIPAIILSIVEAAGVDANRLGCGISRLNAMGLSWVLLNYSMELQQAPALGEKIDIETWISDCSRITSIRNFVIRNSRGERIGTVSTQWCMIDLETRRAVNLLTSEINYPQYVSNRAAELSTLRKFPNLEGNESEYQHTVDKDDLDFNNHVNTIRYIEMMITMLPEELHHNISPTRTDFHFISESRLGDTLTIKRKEQLQPEGQQSLFEIIRQDGTTSVKALFTWY
ncbi:MAG: 5-formyltetrahydrofolate cyclo-ligase [Rikenellaceae bacterium]